MNKFNVGDAVIEVSQEGFRIGIVENVIENLIDNPKRFKILKAIENLNKAIMFEDYTYFNKNAKVVWNFKCLTRCRFAIKKYESILKDTPKKIAKYKYLVVYDNHKHTEISEEKSLHNIKNIGNFEINLKEI